MTKPTLTAAHSFDISRGEHTRGLPAQQLLTSNSKDLTRWAREAPLCLPRVSV